MRTLVVTVLITASIAFLFQVPARTADTDTRPNGVRLTKYIIGVADLEKTWAFYRAIGLELDGAQALQKPATLADFLLKLVDVPPGTKFRNAMLKIPGAGFPLEVTEFSNMPLRPGRPRVQDPGASVLVLTVRDIGAALAAAKKAGGEVVTLGGAPVPSGADNAPPAIIVRDPDSYYVEFVQPSPPPATTAAPGSNVIGARFGSVVKDAEQAARFYKERFGLETDVKEWTSDEHLLKLTGLQRGQLRRASVTVPGTTLSWTFAEFKNTDGKPYSLRIPDPGAPAVGLQVRDLARAAAAFASSGGSVITTGDGHIAVPTGELVAFTRDPQGILVQLAQSAPPK